MKGLKYDGGKLRMDLIEPECIEGLASVLTFGAEKYEDNSWQHVENAENRYYAALLRHIMQWRLGNEVDEESGIHHLNHAMANIMFLLHGDREKEKCLKLIEG